MAAGCRTSLCSTVSLPKSSRPRPRRSQPKAGSGSRSPSISPTATPDGLRELEGKPVDLTIEEQATIDALNAEQAKLESEYQDADELPDEVDQRLGEIEAALVAFEDRSMIYDPADIARAGVFVSIDSEGRLSVDRGYVRPEDEAPVADPRSGRAPIRQSIERPRRLVLPCQRTVISVAGGAD